MLWIMNPVPVLSTVHMPASDSLATLAPLMTVAEYETGGFVRLIAKEHEPQIEYSAASAWFKPIEAWARARGYGWVRFDSVGDPVDGLPTFDW